MRIVKYIIISTVFFCAASVMFSTLDLPMDDYFFSNSPVFVRLKNKLPLVFRYVASYSLYISVLFVSYLLLDKKYNMLSYNMICKLESFAPPSLQDGKTQAVNERTQLFFISLYSVGLVAIRNWPSVLHGYFKYDDFEFFSYNRTSTLLSLLVTPHGDHLLPLYRLEVAVMHYLFGVNPFFYNLFVSLLFALLVLFAGLLLRELGVGPFSLLLFSILGISWVNWGEMVAGYFCISVYIQIALLALIAIWSYFRWRKTSFKIYPPITILCMGGALLLDISGVWVPLAVVIFSFGVRFNGKPCLMLSCWYKANRWLFAATTTLYFVFTMLTFIVFTYCNHGVFLSMSGAHHHTFFSFLSQFFYTVFGGLFLAPIFPIGYHLLPQNILLVLLTVLFIAAVWIMCDVLKNSEGKTRWHIIAVVLIIVTNVVLVTIGRPMAGFNYVLATKYTGVPYLWFCFLICLIWNHYWQRVELLAKKRMATISILVLFFYVGHQLFFDRMLYLYQAEISGFNANVVEAKIRKNNINEMKEGFITPLFITANDKVVNIPSLDGKFIYNSYRQLFTYNLSHYVDFIVPLDKKIVLYRNKSMQDWVAKDVVTVTSLRSSVDSKFIEYLQSNKYIQKLYLSSIVLNTSNYLNEKHKHKSVAIKQIKNAAEMVQQADGKISFTSNGTTELVVDNDTWDPEKRHLLVLSLEHQGVNLTEDIKLELEFAGSLNIPYNKQTIVIPPNKKNSITVDLLQLYSYSLNPQVGNLRIFFSTPGNYHLSEVSLI